MPTTEVLHERSNEGLDVELHWNRDSGATFINIRDQAERERFFEVQPQDAMEAFRHPFTFVGR